MTSHVHLIIGISGNPLQNIMRNFKLFQGTDTQVHNAMQHICARVGLAQRVTKKTKSSKKLHLPEENIVVSHKEV